MLRGVIVLTKAQVERLAKIIEKEKYRQTVTYAKVASALAQNLENIPLEFSEDEVENILDELEPDPNDDLRNVLSTSVLSWRSSI